MLRTTRKLTVTDFGHTVLEHARQVASEVEAAESLAQNRQIERPAPPAGFDAGRFRQHADETLSEFIAKYPSVALELDLTARRVDLIGENFDLAIAWAI